MEDQIFEKSTDISALNEVMKSVKDEIAKVIVGQDNMIELMLTGLLCEGHILIEGVPGVAKTLTSKLLARIIQTSFSRIQFTPDLMPVDVLGTSVFNPETTNFEFKQGPIFSNIILIDEINRAPAKTQSALFEVMEERQVTIDGHTHPMEFPFLVLATQNPIEQEGTYRLPEAQLDRFLFKVVVDYPSLENEISILTNQQSYNVPALISSVNPVLSHQDLLQLKTIVNGVMVEHGLIEYIARIVHATRNNSSLFLGASPRASLAILKSAKATAALKGRNFVTPEDVVEMTLPVLRHRLILTPEKEMEGILPDELIKQIVAEIEVPR